MKSIVNIVVQDRLSKVKEGKVMIGMFGSGLTWGYTTNSSTVTYSPFQLYIANDNLYDDDSIAVISNGNTLHPFWTEDDNDDNDDDSYELTAQEDRDVGGQLRP